MASSLIGNIVLFSVAMGLALLIAHKTRFPNKKAMPIIGLGAGIWVVIIITLQVISIMVCTMIFLIGYCLGLYTTGKEEGKWEGKIKSFLKENLGKLYELIKRKVMGQLSKIGKGSNST